MINKRTREFYHTNSQMAEDLISITPIEGSVLDAGSGDLVWYRHLVGEKYECDIERGCDFYKWDTQVDWIVGNPPFHESWKFFEHGSTVALHGIAFLINNQALNSWTPRRYETMENRGFYLSRIHVVMDKRWFGRYYYMIFTKKDVGFISWNTKVYGK